MAPVAVARSVLRGPSEDTVAPLRAALGAERLALLLPDVAADRCRLFVVLHHHRPPATSAPSFLALTFGPDAGAGADADADVPDGLRRLAAWLS